MFDVLGRLDIRQLGNDNYSTIANRTQGISLPFHFKVALCYWKMGLLKMLTFLKCLCSPCLNRLFAGRDWQAGVPSVHEHDVRQLDAGFAAADAVRRRQVLGDEGE